MVTSRLAASIRRGERQLAQYLITCPGCSKPGAAHVDRGEGEPAEPVLVRFVCLAGCAVDAATVLARIPGHPSALTA